MKKIKEDKAKIANALKNALAEQLGSHFVNALGETHDTGIICDYKLLVVLHTKSDCPASQEMERQLLDLYTQYNTNP